MAGPKSKDKAPISLVPVEAITGMAMAFKYGAEKHGKYNFRNNDITYTELIDALLRHTLAFLNGEDNDPESGLPHTYHLGANFAMLEYNRVNFPNKDDRYNKSSKNSLSIPGWDEIVIPVFGYIPEKKLNKKDKK